MLSPQLQNLFVLQARVWRRGALVGLAIGLLAGAALAQVPACVHRARTVHQLRASGVGAASGDEAPAPPRVR